MLKYFWYLCSNFLALFSSLVYVYMSSDVTRSSSRRKNDLFLNVQFIFFLFTDCRPQSPTHPTSVRSFFTEHISDRFLNGTPPNRPPMGNTFTSTSDHISSSRYVYYIFHTTSSDVTRKRENISRVQAF